jgi:prophage antirepressor-like protein
MMESITLAFDDKHLRIGTYDVTTWVDDVNGCTWFAAKELARALEYKDPSRSIRSRVDVMFRAQLGDVMPHLTLRHNERIKTIVSEPGVWALLSGSSMRAARIVQYWMFTDVMPTLRKSGQYRLGQCNHQPSAFTSKLNAMESRFAERKIAGVMQTSFPDLAMTFDQRVCEDYRPDIAIHASKIIFVEVDEHQHDRYDQIEEDRRMKSIATSQRVPAFFVRFNPDQYIDATGAIHPAMYQRDGMGIHENVVQCEHRLSTLVATITRILSGDPTPFVTKLFFDA